jgi:hypothetical protein
MLLTLAVLQACKVKEFSDVPTDVIGRCKIPDLQNGRSGRVEKA